jgi:hypothetical protein
MTAGSYTKQSVLFDGEFLWFFLYLDVKDCLEPKLKSQAVMCLTLSGIGDSAIFFDESLSETARFTPSAD